MRGLRRKYWGEDLLYAMLALIFAILSIILAVTANHRMDALVNNTAREYDCNTVSFVYNEDKNEAAPLGYSIACKNFTDDGQLTIIYKHHEHAQEWYEQYQRLDIIEWIFGILAAAAIFLFAVFTYQTIDDIIFITKLRRMFDADRREKIESRVFED